MQPLMMFYEKFESTQDNFGKFIYQFQPETKTLIRKLEMILIKLYRQNVSLSLSLYIYIYRERENRIKIKDRQRIFSDNQQ